MAARHGARASEDGRWLSRLEAELLRTRWQQLPALVQHSPARPHRQQRAKRPHGAMLRRLSLSSGTLLQAGLRCLSTAAPVRTAAGIGGAGGLSCCRRRLTARRRLPHSPQELLGRPLPASVTIVEVGPRDGLQNEKNKVRDEAGGAAALSDCRAVPPSTAVA